MKWWLSFASLLVCCNLATAAIEVDAFRTEGSARAGNGGAGPWDVDSIPYPATLGLHEVSAAAGGSSATGDIEYVISSGVTDDTLTFSLGGEAQSVGDEQAGITSGLRFNVSTAAEWTFQGTVLSDSTNEGFAYMEFRIWQFDSATDNVFDNQIEGFHSETTDPNTSLASPVLSGTLAAGSYRAELISYTSKAGLDSDTRGIAESELIFTLTAPEITWNYTPDDPDPDPDPNPVVPEPSSFLCVLGIFICFGFGWLRRRSTQRKE